MAFRWASLFALVCMVVVVAAQDEEPATFRWVEVSAGVGGCTAGMMLFIGIFFAIYDFTCRNYYSGRAGDYFRQDAEVAAGNSTKL